MSYEAVAFAVDGVLTHPTPAETRRAAVAAAFRAVGADPAPIPGAVDDLLDATVGRVRAACDRHGVDPAAFWAKREAYAAATERTAMLDGRKPLYDDVGPALDALDCPVAVAGDVTAATVEHLLDVSGLDGRVSAAVGRRPTLDAYARRAPDPHRLERALDALGTRNALAVADGNAGLVAADRAGVDAAFVRRPHRLGYELAADPTYELDSLTDLGGVVGTDTDTETGGTTGSDSGTDGADRPGSNPNRVA